MTNNNIDISNVIPVTETEAGISFPNSHEDGRVVPVESTEQATTMWALGETLDNIVKINPTLVGFKTGIEYSRSIAKVIPAALKMAFPKEGTPITADEFNEPKNPIEKFVSVLSDAIMPGQPDILKKLIYNRPLSTLGILGKAMIPLWGMNEMAKGIAKEFEGDKIPSASEIVEGAVMSFVEPTKTWSEMVVAKYDVKKVSTAYAIASITSIVDAEAILGLGSSFSSGVTNQARKMFLDTIVEGEMFHSGASAQSAKTTAWGVYQKLRIAERNPLAIISKINRMRDIYHLNPLKPEVIPRSVISSLSNAQGSTPIFTSSEMGIAVKILNKASKTEFLTSTAGKVADALGVVAAELSQKEIAQYIMESEVTSKGGKRRVIPLDIYQSTFNSMQSIEDAVTRAKKFGMVIKPGEDAGMLARSYLGVTKATDQVLRNGPFKITPDGNIEVVGEGLLPILNDYEKMIPEKNRQQRAADFNDYFQSTRVIEDLQREVEAGGKTKKIASAKQTAEAMQTLINLQHKYGDSYKVFEEIAPRIYDFQKEVLHMLVESGIMSPQMEAKILKNNPHYIPSFRVIEDEFSGITPKSSGAFTKARSPIKAIKGSDLETRDTVESIIKNTYTIMDRVYRNKVAINIAKMADFLPDQITVVKPDMLPIKVSAREMSDVAVESLEVTPEDSLAEQAKKFPNAEAFVAAQPKVYHGTNQPFDVFDKGLKGQDVKAKSAKEGYWFTSSEEEAQDYANYSAQRNVPSQVEHEAKVEKLLKRIAQAEKARNFDLAERLTDEVETLEADAIQAEPSGQRVIEASLEIKNPLMVDASAEDFEFMKHINKAKKDGNDAVIFENMVDSPSKQFTTTHYMVFDKSQIKTKQQLTDVFNKAKRETSEAEGVTIFRPSAFPPKGKVIEYYENGKKKFIEVDDNLYKSMAELSIQQSSLMVKILSAPTQLLRVGATITPEFMVKNVIRDGFTAFIQTQVGFLPIIDPALAVADVLGKSDVYNDWLRSGAAYSGLVSLSQEGLRKAVDGLTKNPSVLRHLNLVTTASELSALLETATRVGAFKRAKGKGKSDIEAGFISRESTVDFGVAGTEAKKANKLIAFFNAGLQGIRTMAKAHKKDPLGTFSKAVIAVTLPEIALYLAYKDDKEMRELPTWRKDLTYTFRVGNQLWSVPKPLGYGQVYGGMVRRFLEYLDGKGTDDVRSLLFNLVESFSPVSVAHENDFLSGFIPTGMKAPLENITNYNFFTGRAIVPQGREKLVASEQHTKYTPVTFKELGKRFNMSPAKIQNFARGFLGGSAKYITDTTDILINSINKSAGVKSDVKRPKTLSDVPLVRGFAVRSPYANSQAIQDFYRMNEKVSAVNATYNKMISEGRDKDASVFRRKNRKVLDAYLDFDSALTNIRGYSQDNDEIINQNIGDAYKQSKMLINDKKKTAEARKIVNKYNKLVRP